MIKPLLRLKSTGVTLMLLLLVSTTVFAQRSITGTVTSSESGEALPGVSILVKGTTNGTISNADGSYNLSVAEDATTLVFTFVGMIAQEVEIGAQSIIDVQLAEDALALSEVVVIGYGEQEKSVVTAAISSINAKDLANYSAGSVDQALQGRMAGVQVTPTSGSPGSGYDIKIRGAGSNGTTRPLFIVDGMRVSSMDYLDPFEIDRVEVLKDAASAAIYGAEGANGVVYITTKEGTNGPGKISYDFQYGIQDFNSKLEVMNLDQFEEYNAEAGITRQAIEVLPAQGTNWVEEIFQTAPMQRHALSFSGGNDKTKYMIGGNYFSQEGIVGGDKAKFDRLSIRLNLEHDVNDWLKITNKFSFSNYKRASILENSEFGGIVQSGIVMDPATPVVYTNGLPDWVIADPSQGGYGLVDANGDPLAYPVDANGNFYGISTLVDGETANPIGRMAQNHGETKQSLFSGTTAARIRIIEGLHFTSRFGLFAGYGVDRSWQNNYFFNDREVGNANVTQSYFDRVNYQWENFVSYDKKFGDHGFNFLAGTSVFSSENGYVSGRGTTLLNDIDQLAYLDAVPNRIQNTDANGNRNRNTLLSYFGRVNYNYKNRYLLGVTMRADGSSLLAEGKQWGYFPSVSGGWIMSNEDFFSLGALNFLKLRASWGKNGSLSNIGVGAALAKVSAGFVYVDDAGNFRTGAEPTTLANPDLSWETSVQTDIGLDFGFFDDRLSGSIDYFIKDTEGLIVPGTPPSFVGNPSGPVNLGDVQNKGFEVELSFREARSSSFKYDIGLNFTSIKNEATKVDPNKLFEAGANIGVDWTSATAMEQGKPIWYFRGYQTNGIFQNQAEIDEYKQLVTSGYDPMPGDPIITDHNGDGLISSADFVEIGSPHPDFSIGTTIKLEYKGFDLNLFAQGAFGQEVIMGFNRTDRIQANKPSFFYEDRWTGEGSTNSWFRAGANPLSYTSDMMVFDGSYFKIRQLQLGYNLPSNIINKVGVNKLRIYISMDNYFTFTSYKGFDPEIGGSNNANSLGIDRGSYPVPKTFLTGLSIQF